MADVVRGRGDAAPPSLRAIAMDAAGMATVEDHHQVAAVGKLAVHSMDLVVVDHLLARPVEVPGHERFDVISCRWNCRRIQAPARHARCRKGTVRRRAWARPAAIGYARESPPWSPGRRDGCANGVGESTPGSRRTELIVKTSLTQPSSRLAGLGYSLMPMSRARWVFFAWRMARLLTPRTRPEGPRPISCWLIGVHTFYGRRVMAGSLFRRVVGDARLVEGRVGVC